MTEYEKYINYDIDLVLKGLMPTDPSETFDKYTLLTGFKRSFANIVTRNQKIYTTPVSCSYKAKGAIVASENFYHIPVKAKRIETEEKKEEFSIRFFVSTTPACEDKANGASALDQLYMCIIASNITDPDVKFTVNEIWATPTSNPASNLRYSFYDGGCTFTDQEHESGAVDEETGEPEEHSLEEEIKIALALGQAMKFTGYSTIYYHIDVSICMVESLCAMPCDLEAMVRSFSSNKLRDSANPGTRPGGIGRSFPMPGVELPLSKNQEMTQMKWLIQHGLPPSTDLDQLYAYVDKKMEEQLHKKKTSGNTKVHTVPLSEIVKSYKYYLESIGMGKRKRRSIIQQISPRLSRNRRALRKHLRTRMRRSIRKIRSFGVGGIGGFGLGLPKSGSTLGNPIPENYKPVDISSDYDYDAGEDEEHTVSMPQIKKLYNTHKKIIPTVNFDNNAVPTENPLSIKLKSSRSKTIADSIDLANNSLNTESLARSSDPNLISGVGDYTTEGVIFSSQPIYINSQNMKSLNRGVYDSDGKLIEDDSFSDYDDNLRVSDYEITQTFHLSENLANVILFSLVGVATILTVIFLSLIIYNHKHKMKNKKSVEKQINIQREIIEKQLESGEVTLEQLQRDLEGMEREMAASTAGHFGSMIDRKVSFNISEASST